MIRIMANFSFNSSRAPIYSEELLRRAEDDLIALNELEAFNSSFYTELNASVDSVILAVEAFTKVGNHAIRKKNECGIVDFLYGSMAEVAKESEGSLLDAVTIIINRVNDSHKDKKRFIQEAKNDIYRNLQHELDGTGVVVSETLYPNLCAFLTEYPKELEKRKEAEEAKAIEQAKRGVPCVGHVCSDKSISVSKKMPAIQFFNEDAPEAKMTAKKEAPKSKPIDNDLYSPSEFNEMKTFVEKYRDRGLYQAIAVLEGLPSPEIPKSGDTPKTSALEGKKSPKSKPLDRLFSTSEHEEVEKWREKYGSKFLSDAAKALEGMPSYEKSKGVDAPKTSDLEGKKKSPKKEAPKANNGSEEFHIVFLDEDGVEYEVPEDDILELLAFMEMLDEEDDEF